ncbi:cobalamin biosynthesis protein [Anabaena cylindrica FACHB-243]|uniref:Cobalamin (Vitamin B12) biosynthesis CbiG protein n=1 Tax=Anabaena cylindrica (strain ATCC 27899 / PCC 7122) TaxID=272123 RepID=K9ZNZ8_ANACC|nr:MULTISPECIES: cobalamin biosynthesis protein [Anabaena]AFZ60055.1 cobalamin (vitamin B12) biosynthesis CbiG protein [Anabaena cylindrica PCC 7122]MBD2417889.1 cobalamin biosynthesis protein [Anabaena cylindrica FACHB-243]MBY5282530.1 cobalamin biosynthesis protein [Anabaena sp. CCAP 1446/1C]MBY5307467.1 cobalamin biosynthesis protein [Anabaena sp. CCAP 1446/1C]MCM2404805.1 cobalamin biosynthesis protein [Anabaena sp. CCAP 1446/1C]
MQVDLFFLQVLWVGIGCQKGISYHLINAAIEKIFREYQLADTDIAGIATIESKALEVGLREFCHIHNFPLKTFTAEFLSSVCVPNPAKIVEGLVGTPSVAEASAILAAKEIAADGVRLLVPKQIFRLPGESGSITIAVAQGIRGFI